MGLSYSSIVQEAHNGGVEVLFGNALVIRSMQPILGISQANNINAQIIIGGRRRVVSRFTPYTPNRFKRERESLLSSILGQQNRIALSKEVVFFFTKNSNTWVCHGVQKEALWSAIIIQ